jgi:hypothetical protein
MKSTQKETKSNIEKDTRYRFIAPLIRSKEINGMADIFECIPKSVVAADLGMNTQRINAKLANPLDWRMSELVALCELIGISLPDFFQLFLKECNSFIAEKKRKSFITNL